VVSDQVAVRSWSRSGSRRTWCEDALLLDVSVPFGLPSAMALHDGINTIPVEACDQMGDRITTPSASGSGGCFVARSIGDGEQFCGSGHLCCGVAPGAAQVLEGTAFIGREGTEGIFLVTGHGILRGGETVNP